MSDPGLLVVLTGPSGAGKSTLVERAQKALPELVFSVSYTTRPPRRGEVDGVHYHFVDESDFRARLDGGEFLEAARVHGNYYGTHRDAVQARIDAGQVVLLDIDVQGARQVRISGVDAVFVFVLPPSFETLERRLRGRGTDSEAVIRGRLDVARAEVGESPWFDYPIVNDALEAAAEDLLAVLRAERVKRRRGAVARRLDLFGLSG